MSTLKVSTLNLNSSENTKIAIATNDLEMAFTVNAAERIRINSNGNVGIGTTTPQAPLHVSTSTAANAIFVSQSGSGNALYIEDSAGDPTPTIIDGVGRIVQGSPTALALGASGQLYKIQTHGVSATFALQSIGTANWGLTTGGSGYSMAKSRSDTIGIHSTLNSGDTIGQIRWLPSNGTQFMVASTISVESEGATSATSTPTRMIFTTTPVNSTADVERMRIDSAGNVLIGRTNSTVGQGVDLDVNGAVNASAYLVNGTALTAPIVATVVEMEAATSNTVFVSPGRQHYHPSAAKFWVKADVAGATQSTYNVTSVTDAAVGQIVINISNGFSSTNWVCMALAYGAPSRIVTANSTQAQATNTIKLSSASAGTTYADPVNYYVVGFGDLP